MQALCDNLHNGGIVYHTDFNGGRLQVVRYGQDLGTNNIGRKRVDGLYAQCVLRGNGSDDGGGITTQGGYSLDVGLDAGAAGTVGTGNGEENGGESWELKIEN